MNVLDKPQLLEQLAASYALGTLRGPARRRFEQLARTSPVARAQALIWQERLASLTELQPAEVPSENVWKRIANVVESQRTASARPAPVAAADTALADRLRRALAWWRGAALAGVAVAAVAGVNTWLVGRQLEFDTQQLAQQLGQAREQSAGLLAQLKAQPDIRYVAVLADDKSAPALLVTVDPAKQTLVLKRVGDYQEAPDRSLQLWALPGAGASGGPRSLGVLGHDKVIRLTAADATVRDVPALAISLEPQGGVSGENGPSGPVVFKGALLSTAL